MMDASAEERAAHLRRIAATEIACHRETQGFLGAALEGSLATGSVWPTSDVDFTIVPHPEASVEDLLEGERHESLPFLKAHADRRIHIDVCGQREGIPWHKHITDPRALLDLVGGYPASFIRPAEGPFDPAAHWFLEGLAVMELVEDPEGLLGDTRRFVSERRFTPEVWEGRRLALLQELRRQRDLAHAAMERGEAETVYQILSGDSGFAAAAARLWLEGARRICSTKEQDGRLAEVATDAGCPEAHALYRRILAVEPERAQAASPLLLKLSERAALLYQLMATAPPEDPPRRREATVWGAYVRHLAGALALAPGWGHPAHLYQSLPAVRLWAIEYPRRVIELLREKDAPVVPVLNQRACDVAGLAEQIQRGLRDPQHSMDRAHACLTAADRLLHLTEARL